MEVENYLISLYLTKSFKLSVRVYTCQLLNTFYSGLQSHLHVSWIGLEQLVIPWIPKSMREGLKSLVESGDTKIYI